jgi:hypothetical protein
LRCIAYNAHRMVKLVVIMMVSTQPFTSSCLYESNYKTIFLSLKC